MKPWQEDLKRLLAEIWTKGEERFRTPEILSRLKEMGNEALTLSRLGRTLRDWNIPKRQWRKNGKKVKGRYLDKEKAKKFLSELKVGMKCPICKWRGYATLKPGEEIDRYGDGIVKKGTRGKGADYKPCFCPRSGDRAYFQSGPVNYEGGEVLYSAPREEEPRARERGPLEASHLWDGPW